MKTKLYKYEKKSLISPFFIIFLFPDRTAKVWDLETGEEVLSLAGHPNNVTAVRYSEESHLIYTVSTYFVKVWDIRDTKRSIKTLVYVLLLSQFSYVCRQQWTSKDWWRIYWLHILQYTDSRDNGFHIVTHEMFDCFVQASQWPSLLVVTCHCELHD